MDDADFELEETVAAPVEKKKGKKATATSKSKQKGQASSLGEDGLPLALQVSKLAICLLDGVASFCFTILVYYDVLCRRKKWR